MKYRHPRDPTERELIRLIKQVNTYDRDGVLKNFYTDGFCLDFAYMLWRYIENLKIFYHREWSHCLVEYKGRFYDITGEVRNVDRQQLKESDYILPMWLPHN